MMCGVCRKWLAASFTFRYVCLASFSGSSSLVIRFQLHRSYAGLAENFCRIDPERLSNAGHGVPGRAMNPAAFEIADGALIDASRFRELRLRNAFQLARGSELHVGIDTALNVFCQPPQDIYASKPG